MSKYGEPERGTRNWDVPLRDVFDNIEVDVDSVRSIANANTAAIGSVESGAFSAFTDEANVVSKTGTREISVSGVDVSSEYTLRRAILPNGLAANLNHVASSEFVGGNTVVTTFDDISPSTVTSLKKGILVSAAPLSEYRLVATPENVSPSNGETGVFPINLTGTPFQSLYGIDRQSREARISTSLDMSNIVTTESSNSDTINIDYNLLSENTTYYFDLKDTDILSNASFRSVPTEFTTADHFNPWPDWDGSLDGTPLVVNAALTTNTSIVGIDALHALCFYADGGSEIGTVLPLYRDNEITNTWTAGSEIIINNSSTIYNSIVRVDSLHALVFYRDVGNSGLGTAVSLYRDNETTNTWTAGSEFVVNGASVEFCYAASVDELNVLCFYSESNIGKMTPLTRANTNTNTWSVGPEVTINLETTAACKVVGIDSLHALCFYLDSSAKVCPVSRANSTTDIWEVGTELSVGDSVFYSSMSKIDSLTAVCFFSDPNDLLKGKAVPLYRDNESTNTWTAGSSLEINSGSTAWVSVSGIDALSFLCFFQDTDNSSYGTVRAVTRVDASSTLWTIGGKIVKNNAETQSCSVSGVDEDNALIFYRDVGNANSGTIISIVG